ncbi:two-component system OmpR family response regulator [Desulfitispora alkaliphila]|uniref:response regulator transcription factor n=1 Tax=Desulfitispora alkaliphila TaxID=622674 RepID=UPI003D1DC689
MAVGNKLKLLVVEDEIKIAEMVKSYMEAEGYQVKAAWDGQEGLELALSWKPDLIVLDIMLPSKSGLDVCKELRSKSQVPIIMLTAKSQEIDKLLGLELGADDYVTKPFSLAELTARVKAVIRRSYGEQATSEVTRKEELVVGDLKVNLEAHQVFLKDKILSLTPTEFKILQTLMSNPGRVYSRLQLVEAILGEVYSGYERSIDTHVSNLRKKVEVDPANPQYILTVFGIGYKFNSSFKEWKKR